MYDTKEFISEYPDFCKRVLLKYINRPNSKISTMNINIYLEVFDLYLGHQKSVKEISDVPKLILENTNQFKNTIMRIIDREINYSEDSDPVIIEIDNDYNIDEVVDQLIIHDNLITIINNFLTEKEQYIISRRLGIYNGHEYSLNEVAIEMNLCRESVRQREIKIIQKIGYCFYKKYRLGQRCWSNYYEYKLEEWYKQYEKVN